MDDQHPRLRAIDAHPIEHEGQKVVMLRDPEELGQGPLLVPMPMFLIMTFFDGTRGPLAVQAEVEKQFQQLIPIQQIQSILGQIDENYLLDNERSAARRAELEAAFDSLPLREAAHSGTAYPDDPEELVKVFDEFFASDQGPPAREAPHERAPRGLVTPHIDLRQGGPAMAWAFDRLRLAEPPELYIILGVAHQPPSNLYTLTDKDFATPLGPVRTNPEAVARLRELYGAERLDGQYIHKNEHSVEFQAVFLKYLHRDDHDFTILPILCGSIDEHLADEESKPTAREEIAEFHAAVGQLIEEFGPRACIISGVDLSHVGRKFGHDYGADDARAQMVEAADRAMLGCVERRDAEEFFDHFRSDMNGRNVDAVTSVYALLHVLGPGEAELLAYDQYRERETDSMVSYASMALY